MKMFFMLVLMLTAAPALAQSTAAICFGTGEDAFSFIPPPPHSGSGLRTAAFNFNFNTFTAESQAAFQYAANIWSSVLTSAVPIKVNAYYTPLVPGLLGITLPNGRKNFPGAPVKNVWYASCLANAITGTELNPGEYDFDLFLNSNINWYLGTDGNCPAGKYDFVSIALHEICHGLGFVGLAKSVNQMGSFGMVEATDFSPINTSFPFPELEGKPGIFDQFLVNSFENELTDTLIYQNNSYELHEEFTSNAIFFDGENAVNMNSGIKPRIYAPSAFSLGSSLVHLNETTYPPGNDNTLMTPFSGTAQVTHNPGAIALAMLADIGWKVNYNVGILPMPDQVALNIFPNPAGHTVYISSGENHPEKIIVTDLSGKILIEQQVYSEHYYTLDVSGLIQGMYLVKAMQQDQTVTAKLIKQ